MALPAPHKVIILQHAPIIWVLITKKELHAPHIIVLISQHLITLFLYIHCMHHIIWVQDTTWKD